MKGGMVWWWFGLDWIGLVDLVNGLRSMRLFIIVTLGLGVRIIIAN